MTSTKANVIQYNACLPKLLCRQEYYPFVPIAIGMQTSNSWTRTNTTNNYLYNEGTELNNTTGIYETLFRGYDATLGRFMQIDPLAAMDYSTSPFAYARNNPALFNDPNGGQAEVPAGTSVSGYNRMLRTTGRDNSIQDFRSWYEDDSGGRGGFNSDFWSKIFSLASNAKSGTHIYGTNATGTTGYFYESIYGSTGEANVGEAISFVGSWIVTEFILDNEHETQGGVSYATFGPSEGMGSLELLLAGLKPTFDNASRLARSGEKVGDVPLWLWKRSFGKGLRLETNKAIPIGRISATGAIRTANLLNKVGTGLAVAGVLTNGYDIIKDGQLTVGDAFQAGNTAAMIAFPVYGVLFGVVDLGFSVFSDQSLTERIKSGIDSNISGSVSIPGF